MKVSLICAVSQNGVIGSGNKLPWRLPADLKRFKRITMSHSVIMGRKTYESIGKPLPGRTNIVITRDRALKISGCLIAHSLKEALDLVRGEEEIFVIGGASLFKESIKRASRIYLTTIHKDFEGDTHLFKINRKDWNEVSREDVKENGENAYPYSFSILERAL